MRAETLDKLYLEWSNYTKARTEIASIVDQKLRLRATFVCCFLLAGVIVCDAFQIYDLTRKADDPKETAKLVALADKMILASCRLSSTQDADSLAIIDEYVPLAEYVAKRLGSK